MLLVWSISFCIPHPLIQSLSPPLLLLNFERSHKVGQDGLKLLILTNFSSKCLWLQDWTTPYRFCFPYVHICSLESGFSLCWTHPIQLVFHLSFPSRYFVIFHVIYCSPHCLKMCSLIRYIPTFSILASTMVC